MKLVKTPVTYDGYNNHLIDYCWDLHGRLSGFANQAIFQDATTLSMSSNLTVDMINKSKEKYDKLLVCTKTSSFIATLAHSGTTFSYFVSST